ncbi:serine hydrolase domain-containing protein [Paraburkholderia bryophila]|uniref:CubicO group peptidase (Beta-lactamase class C family) n=1 Tax=Paraburkholderia bryophila TaxID=420952 RepID=A0A7Y9WSR6_9BURK|nr:serine hydrolase [Paraburkholderia bryophila]NYH25238.1 CubicO group peptidase (beta-lactamase class C family) [Paraburkholderia bryophila]
MVIGKFLVLSSFLLASAGPAIAAPDEDKLGKALGYPVGNAENWFYDETVRVGSFSHQGEIPNIFGGEAHRLPPAGEPMVLPKAAHEPAICWDSVDARNLNVDDYLSRQRIMGLMIVKDGVIQVERYQYDRGPGDRFLSNSMVKSITSLGIGIALREGKIHSLDERADVYAPGLAGTLYGATTIRNLLRMASGAKFTEIYNGADDAAHYGKVATRDGQEAAARTVTKRAAPQGTRFSYASPQTDMLGLVLHGATGMSLSDYLTSRLWQPIGAATSALWRADRFGQERASAGFNATLADYARLAVVLANDGVRPDDPQHRQIIPLDYLLNATDWHRVPEAFRPHNAAPYYGYGYQFWLFPGEQRRFAMLGVYGQMIFVDPQRKLVMVQTAANATAKVGGSGTSLGKEADEFWRGVERGCGGGVTASSQ